jgi:hypothetical protein
VPPRPTLLRLEELDARTLPSVTIPTTTAPAAAAAAPNPSHPLHGTGAGHYLGHSLVVDAGLSYALTGKADLAGLGSFKMSGWVQGVGMVASGRATGQLVLSSAQGTITLALHGRVQPGFSPLPAELVYSVSGGTGAYQHLSGYGVVGLTIMPAPIAFGFPPEGLFTLRFY